MKMNITTYSKYMPSIDTLKKRLKLKRVFILSLKANAGTLIVYDSDLFHKVGQIRKQGMERLVIRIHSYLS